MALVESTPPGSPCWIELGTTDQDGAKRFYTALFGWTVSDFPIGPAESYSMFHLDGSATGAAYTLNSQQKAQRDPPNWMIYFATADADATVARAERLGGTVLAPAFEVMDAGRMAVIRDPVGAAFSVWQVRRHKGAGVVNQPNAMAWTELAARDQDRAAGFYTALFGWEPSEMQTPGGAYLVMKNAGANVGGIMAMDAAWGDTPPHWTVYFQVEDCGAAAAKVRDLGGAIRHGPFEGGDVGWIAMAADPQGAGFNLIQLRAR